MVAMNTLGSYSKELKVAGDRREIPWPKWKTTASRLHPQCKGTENMWGVGMSQCGGSPGTGL